MLLVLVSIQDTKVKCTLNGKSLIYLKQSFLLNNINIVEALRFDISQL